MLSPQTIFGVLYQDHPEHNPYSSYPTYPYTITPITGQTSTNSNVWVDLLWGVSGFIGGFNSFIANDVLRLDTWAGWASGVTDPLLGEGWSRAVALPLGVVDFITLGLLNGACTLVDTGFDIGEAYQATDVPELVDWVRTIIDPTYPATLGERGIALALAVPMILTRGKARSILANLETQGLIKYLPKSIISLVERENPIIYSKPINPKYTGRYDTLTNEIVISRYLKEIEELQSYAHEFTHVAQRDDILRVFGDTIRNLKTLDEKENLAEFVRIMLEFEYEAYKVEERFIWDAGLVKDKTGLLTLDRNGKLKPEKID